VASEATKAAAQQRAANKTASRTRTFAAAQKTENTKTVDPTDVIILNIMARPQHHFAGDAIVKAALLCGLRYGENNIFHFYEPSSVSRKDKSIFSLVNVVKPGTFDMNNMQNFTSPGLCLFMGVPGPDNIEASFQKMLLVAHKLANQLDTDLYDELHNPLTQKRLKQIHERVVQLHQAQMEAQGSDHSSPAHSSMA
jgi:cell division protein ZipA